jgi:hypothetical protein
MPAKLTTTINKIQSVPNQTNLVIINEFYQYMKDSDSSLHHKKNNLKVVIAFPISCVAVLARFSLFFLSSLANA